MYYNELKELVGKKINQVFINSEYLRFNTDGGDFTYRVDGDCCSTSVFYDFYGVKNLLKNGKVKEVKQVDLHPDLDKDIHKFDDSIQVYGYQITTESEEFGEMTSVFSFRNYSNGYYGGDISLSNNVDGLPEITDDVIGVK